jgi:hypothetical protein
VFNVDKTGLFWKGMPTRKYIPKEVRTAPGFKAAKDQVIVMFGLKDIAKLIQVTVVKTNPL